MVPAVLPILLLLIPSILAALAVVSEKEFGSIINFYVTPVTRLEFLQQKRWTDLDIATFVLVVGSKIRELCISRASKAECQLKPRNVHLRHHDVPWFRGARQAAQVLSNWAAD
jgi:hypothetical protein